MTRGIRICCADMGDAVLHGNITHTEYNGEWQVYLNEGAAPINYCPWCKAEIEIVNCGEEKNESKT